MTREQIRANSLKIIVVVDVVGSDTGKGFGSFVGAGFVAVVDPSQRGERRLGRRWGRCPESLGCVEG
eukprot:5434816-Pyramimonas_sp.AAC.1